ncbi:hypothetical protein AN944_02295 [Shewanella sp. P1-14-1]|nr:hypothetical protein AN944_02295 [Shewanella sp. P1-14-1]
MTECLSTNKDGLPIVARLPQSGKVMIEITA